LFQIGGTISTSIGGSIAGAVWNAILPQELTKHVPGEFDLAQMMGTIDYILSRPADQRAGLNIAYGNTQRILSIISLCLSIIAFGFFLRMKPFGLSEQDSHGDDTAAEEHTDEQLTDDYGSIKKDNNRK
jgi:hypothetical protein